MIPAAILLVFLGAHRGAPDCEAIGALLLRVASLGFRNWGCYRSGGGEQSSEENGRRVLHGWTGVVENEKVTFIEEGWTGPSGKC